MNLQIQNNFHTSQLILFNIQQKKIKIKERIQLN